MATERIEQQRKAREFKERKRTETKGRAFPETPTSVRPSQDAPLIPSEQTQKEAVRRAKIQERVSGLDEFGRPLPQQAAQAQPKTTLPQIQQTTIPGQITEAPKETANFIQNAVGRFIQATGGQVLLDEQGNMRPSTPEEARAVQELVTSVTLSAVPAVPALGALAAKGTAAVGELPQIFDGALKQYRPMTQAEHAFFVSQKLAQAGKFQAALKSPYLTGTQKAVTLGKITYNSKTLGIVTGLARNVIGKSLSLQGLILGIGFYMMQSASGDFANPISKQIDISIREAYRANDLTLVAALEQQKVDLWNAQKEVDNIPGIQAIFNVKRKRASEERTKAQEALSPLKNQVARAVAESRTDQTKIKTFIKDAEQKKEEALLEIDSRFKAEEDLLQGEISATDDREYEKFLTRELSRLRSNHELLKAAETKKHNALILEYTKKLNDVAEASIEEADLIGEESRGILAGLF